MSADLLLPWPVVATRKKLEIQTQLKVGIKQLNERLGDARYIYEVNICTIVSFYCVKSIVLLCKG